jgi:hypothetical protein
MTRQQLLARIESAWTAFKQSYDGLLESRLVEPGVTKAWSVKDIIAHIRTWENEALRHLPTVLKGGRPPRYASEGRIDAFNARMTKAKQELPLEEVLRELDDTHQPLIEFIHTVSEEQITHETRFRRRLSLDTYGHYPKHTSAILRWRRDRGL